MGADKRFQGLVHKEFMRQSYHKYKHKFPKMRESENVRKCIEDWGLLNDEMKLELGQLYLKNKVFTWPPPPTRITITDNGLVLESPITPPPHPPSPKPNHPKPEIKTFILEHHFPAPLPGKFYDEDSDFRRD